MKKIFLCISVCLLAMRSPGAGLVNGTLSASMTASNISGVVQLVNGGTGNSGTNTYVTNTFTNATNIYVTGSTVANVNGVYTNNFTNNGTGQAIWTNVGNGFILYLNDPGVNAGGVPWTLEHAPNDASSLYLSSLADLQANNGGSWVPNTAPGGDVLNTLYGTNYTTNTYPLVLATNIVFTLSQTNVFVDSVLGNDTLAIGSSVPFKTITNAVKSPNLANGGIITLAPGNYPDTGIVLLPAGTTLNGNRAILTGANVQVVLANNCTVQDLIITNGTLNTLSSPNNVLYTNLVIRNVYAHGRIDGAYFYYIFTLDIINCDLGSGWDSLAILGSTNGTLVRVINSKLSSAFVSGVEETTGMHGIVFAPNVGGKLQIEGCYISVFNPTNTAYSGTTIQGNAALMIGGTGPNLTSFGNASVEIYNTTFIHGTTNSGALSAAVYNAAGVPVSGSWYDTIISTNFNSPSNTTQINTWLSSTTTQPTNTFNGNGSNILAGGNFTANATFTTSTNTGTSGVAGLFYAGGGIVGTTAAGNATAGNLGEYAQTIVAPTAASGFSTATASNLMSVTLSAGDWDVHANLNFAGTASTITQQAAGITTTTGTIPTDGSAVYSDASITTSTLTNSLVCPLKRINVSGSTTVFLVGKVSFSAGTVAGFGQIEARRVR